MDLKTFLLARIAEDEAVVAHPDEHERNGGYRYVDVGGLNDVLTVGTARVLAECAAKRAIITYSPPRTLSHLAAVYADHQDYQLEWAQEASQA